MPNLADLATQVGLVVLAQALAIVATPQAAPDPDQPPETAGYSRPAGTDLATVAAGKGPSAAASGDVTAHGKLQDRLVPELIAQDGARLSKGDRGLPRQQTVYVCEGGATESGCTFRMLERVAVDRLCPGDAQGSTSSCVPVSELRGKDA